MWRGQASRTVVLGFAMAVFGVCCILPVGYVLLTTLRATKVRTGHCCSTSASEDCSSTRPCSARVPPSSRRCSVRRWDSLWLACRWRRKGLSGWRWRLRPCCRLTSWLSPGSYLGSTQAVSGGHGRVSLSAWTYSLPGAIIVLEPGALSDVDAGDEMALRRIDGRLEEAAMMVAPRGRLLRRITLPLVAPSVSRLRTGDLRARDFGVRRPWAAARPGLHDRGVYRVCGAV